MRVDDHRRRRESLRTLIPRTVSSERLGRVVHEQRFLRRLGGGAVDASVRPLEARVIAPGGVAAEDDRQAEHGDGDRASFEREHEQHQRDRHEVEPADEVQVMNQLVVLVQAEHPPVDDDRRREERQRRGDEARAAQRDE